MLRLRTFTFFSIILISMQINIASPTGTLGNRFYVKNFLIEKFGNHLEETIDRNIIENPRVFNGPCDIYGQVMHEGPDGELVHKNLEAKCHGDISDSKISLLGSNSSLRKSWLLKTCLEISNSSQTMDLIKEKEVFVKNYFNYQLDYKKFIKNNDLTKINKKEMVFKLCTSDTWQYI